MNLPVAHFTIAHAVGAEIPVTLKVLYALFLCVLVPCYWRQYGPMNFLWFSDIALLVTFVAVWLENGFLASMQAVSIMLLELVWVVDFFMGLVARKPVIGLANYMFNPEIPRFLRALSLFHLWLPVLLLWLLWRLGYDSRAWLAQSVLAEIILPVCYLMRPTENINWVYGPGEKPQKWIDPRLYLTLLMAFFPLCVYLPTHLGLQWLFSR